jgi:TldD protein
MMDSLARHLGMPADFVDIRAALSTSNSIAAKSGVLESAVSGTMSLFSVRVLDKGAWGFCSTNSLERLPEVARRALKLARVAASRSLDSGLSEEKAHVDRVRMKVGIRPEDVPLEDKAKKLLALNKGMKRERIVSYDASYLDASTHWYYLNSEGSRIESESAGSMLSFAAYAKADTLQAAHENCGGMLGAEVFEKYADKPAEVSEKALGLLKAGLVKSGNYDVVIDPKMAGTLAHEAVGHACEADSVLTGESILRGKLGARLGADGVTICDDPAVAGAFGFYLYDDEGVKASRHVLVHDGVLKSFLHSRETALKMGTHSTANARAQSVGHFPIVRMSNTYFEKGDARFDELIDMPSGVYVEGMKGGAVDISTGNFQFAAERGMLIERGELTKPLRDITIFGNILGTLKNIDGLGKKAGSFHPGTCGKGLQAVRVADNGPAIRIRGARLGGTA